MVSTKLKLTMFNFKVRDIQEQLFTVVAAAVGRFSKYIFLKFMEYSQKNICARILSSSKVQDLRPATLLKRDFNTGVFL